jgi:hypothetical protein
MHFMLQVEMSRWIGKAPFNNLLESIRAVQKADFEKLLAEREASGDTQPAVPTVWLRKDRPAPGSESSSAAPGAKASLQAADASRNTHIY